MLVCTNSNGLFWGINMVGLGIISHYLATLELEVAYLFFLNILEAPDVTILMSYRG